MSPRRRALLFCVVGAVAVAAGCQHRYRVPSGPEPAVLLGDTATPGCSQPVVRGTVTSTQCNELSGLAASMRHAGTLWAVNDSGEAALRVFALDDRGGLQATYTVPGLVPTDVEDLAIWHRPDRSGDLLFVADIGDNLAREGGRGRSSVILYALEEPDPQGPAAIKLAFTLQLTYPDRPHDAEALFVDPVSGALYVFAKETFGPSNYYRLQPPFEEGMRTLELAGSLDVGTVKFPGLMITAASVRPDGGLIAFRTYGSMLAFERPAGATIEASLQGKVHVLPLPGERQGESLAFATDGLGLFSVSEGVQPALHYTSVGCVFGRKDPP